MSPFSARSVPEQPKNFQLLALRHRAVVDERMTAVGTHAENEIMQIAPVLGG